MSNKEKSGISIFQKYLTVWVALCMVVGVLIGKFIPQIPDLVNINYGLFQSSLFR